MGLTSTWVFPTFRCTFKHYFSYKIGLCFAFFHEKCTGKSFSEAIILESVNPQYDDRLCIELQVQYNKNTSSEHVVYKNCSECQNKKKLYTTYTELVIQ